MTTESPIPEDQAVAAPAVTADPNSQAAPPELVEPVAPAEPEPESESHVHEPHAQDDVFQCPNCGTESRGEFCWRCGQKRLHDGDLTLKHAWHHVAHEMVHLDGKILGTVKQLFTQPGQLTLDFVEGRRARHVHPVRLFLLFSAIFFLFPSLQSIVTEIGRTRTARPAAAPAPASTAAPVPAAGSPVGVAADKPRKRDSSAGFEARLRARAAASGLSYDLYLERFNHRAEQVFKLIYIFLVVLEGGLYEHYFRRRFRYFAEHMVFALHVTCFAMVVSVASGMVGKWVFYGAAWMSILSMFVAWAYRVLAVRRVYEEGWGAVARKTLLIAVFRELALCTVYMGLYVLFVIGLI